jgi:hypothetical protein
LFTFYYPQKYEFVLDIKLAQIAWISGPHEASRHDITVFRGGTVEEGKKNWNRNALYFKLDQGKKLIGDDGYSGEPEKITKTQKYHSVELKRFLGRAKTREETLHTRLKSFKILRERFHHGVDTIKRKNLHQMAVEAICVIVQYDYENGHPPFEI